MTPARHQLDLKVRECRNLGAGLHQLILEIPPGLSTWFKAGQFAQLATPGRALPRPFSILRSDSASLEFLVKTVGPGTHWLAARRPGDRVPTLWPLGHGFVDRLPEAGAPAAGGWLLVGGGVGIAPLIALWEQLQGQGETQLEVAFGHRDGLAARAAGLLHVDLHPHLATEDGSLGRCGRVTDLIEDLLAKRESEGRPLPAHLICCGPEPMMEAVARLARERNIPCLLSLETLMGCGIGICVGCAVPLAAGGFALACQEGPVFRAMDLAESADSVS